jgi:phage shock protein A
MALITRLNKLFQADMHAVLDKIEEPEALLKQAIRDMEVAADLEEKQLRLCEVEQELLGKKAQQLSETLAELDGKLALCFQADKDELARSVVKRKLECQQAFTHATDTATALAEKAKHLAKQLGEHQAQLAEMKQKAEVFAREPGNTANAGCATWDNPAAVREEDIDVAFLCEKQKWSAS